MEEIEIKDLLALCSTNDDLFDFILSIVNEYKDEKIPVFTSTNWEWDVEDIDDFGDIDDDEDIDRFIFAQYNMDMAIDMPDEEAWELCQLDTDFLKYFRGFDFNKIRLDNGDYLFLIDNDDYMHFSMYTPDKLKSGAVEGLKWGMEFLYRESI